MKKQKLLIIVLLFALLLPVFVKAEETDLSKTSEPTVTALTSEGTEAGKATEASETAESTESTEATEPTEATDPSQSTEATETTDEFETSESTEDATSTEDSEPSNDPTTSEETQTSEETETSEEPTTPEGETVLPAEKVTGFKARPYGPWQVLLTWEPNGADYYAIYRYLPGNPLQYVYVVDGSRHSYLDSGATNDIFNFYFIFGYNLDETGAQHFGPVSDYVYAKPSIEPLPAVTGLKARPVASNQVKLTWNAVPNADAYAIFKKGASGPLQYLYVVGAERQDFVDLKAPNEVFSFYWVFPYQVLRGQQYFGPAGDYAYARPSKFLGMKRIEAPTALSLNKGRYQFHIPEGYQAQAKVEEQGRTVMMQHLGYGANASPEFYLNAGDHYSVRFFGNAPIYYENVAPGTVTGSGLYQVPGDLQAGRYELRLEGSGRGQVRVLSEPQRRGVRAGLFEATLAEGIKSKVEFSLSGGQLLGIENLPLIAVERLK